MKKSLLLSLLCIVSVHPGEVDFPHVDDLREAGMYGVVFMPSVLAVILPSLGVILKQLLYSSNAPVEIDLNFNDICSLIGSERVTGYEVRDLGPEGTEFTGITETGKKFVCKKPYDGVPECHYYKK